MLQAPPKKDSQQQPAGLPQSEASERAILAAALLAPHVLALVSGRLEIEDFYLERHQLIYKAMLSLQEDGSEIDLRTLQARLELKGWFETVGGFAYLAGLDLDLPDLTRVETYVEIVKERSVRRRLVLACSEVANHLFGRRRRRCRGVGEGRGADLRARAGGDSTGVLAARQGLRGDRRRARGTLRRDARHRHRLLRLGQSDPRPGRGESDHRRRSTGYGQDQLSR